MAEGRLEGKRIALLSNVNMNFVIRMLQKEVEVYETQGYGNELGILMNPQSDYHTFAPKITFFVMDLMELICHDLEPEAAGKHIDEWFGSLEGALDSQCVYYISDACLWGVELSVLADSGRKCKLEQLWQKRLEQLCKDYTNVRILPYRAMLQGLGEENAFSMKMWYMGRILLSNEAQKRLCELVLFKMRLESRTAKKVLLLDLDNTLWGGLAGEAEHTPVTLSEEHSGLAYKNLQRVILQMQRQGVLLAIVSKNNEEDAMAILDKHPHMLLRSECFAAMKINWRPKHENILEIAKDLNLGTDSFVFWDDNPVERGLVQELLPEVVVPDFPEKAEDLASAMTEIYREYFEKSSLTREDLEKTAQYAANAKRSGMQAAAASFEDYLKQLSIVVTRVKSCEHVERLTQLVNKTNQFNLTTKRMEQSEVQSLLKDEHKCVYLYRVSDCFGDNGVVAAVIVDIRNVPVIEEFVMSCRVMGRNIEYAIVTDVEEDLRARGFTCLRGIYLPTAKNKPVERLYEQLGYQRVAGEPEKDSITGDIYEISFSTAPKREYYVTMKQEA